MGRERKSVRKDQKKNERVMYACMRVRKKILKLKKKGLGVRVCVDARKD